MNIAKKKLTERQLGIDNTDVSLPNGVLNRYIPKYLYSINLLGDFLIMVGIYVDRLILSVRYVRDYTELSAQKR